MKRLHCSSGFSLIESMIAMFVMSVSLLGMLGIIANSLKISTSSTYRTVAGQEAYSMAEVLRANPATLDSTVATDAVFSNPTAAVQADCLVTAGCSRSQYVNSTFALWQARLAKALPAGTGRVCRDSNPASHQPTSASSAMNWQCDSSGQYVVKICWDESRIAASKTEADANAGMLCTWTNL